MPLSLSIIIVNYKTPGLLKDCLESVYQHTKSIDFEVLVIDNHSGDNSQEIITSSFPAVRWIQMAYNAGFARANNAGIQQANGKVVLLLNSDTLAYSDAIGACYHSFVQSAYVACGVQLLNVDGSPQISGNFFMKGSLNNLLPLPYIGNFFKWLGNKVKVKKPNVPHATTAIEVDWINGAFLMVKSETIKKAGLLDEDFFLYAEEVEWCSRIRQVGKLCIYGQYTIVHLQGATANEAFNSSDKGYYNLYDRKGLQIMLSNLLRIRKQLGVGWFMFHLVMYTIGVPVYLVGSLLENLVKLRNPFKQFPAAVKFGGNVIKLWLFTPRIISNKPYFYKVL
jgi:hypothetical protein